MFEVKHFSPPPKEE
jgi:serine/threonine protein phosphatase PrpC